MGFLLKVVSDLLVVYIVQLSADPLTAIWAAHPMLVAKLLSAMTHPRMISLPKVPSLGSFLSPLVLGVTW